MGYLATNFVGRRRVVSGSLSCEGEVGRRLRLESDVRGVTELAERIGFVGDGLAVGIVLVGHALDSRALHRLGDDGRGPRISVGGRGQRGIDGLDVVPVDLYGPPTEALESAGVLTQVPTEAGFSTLAQPVDIDDQDQLVEALE